MTPNILELAKQGDAQAIASLMNRQLQPKGITAKVALKDACLQVMLESDQVPNQQALVAFVRKGITGLGAVSIERAKIYGRQIGEEFPAWNQEFEFIVQDRTIISSENKASNLVSRQNQYTESPLLAEAVNIQKNKNLFHEIEGSNGQIRLTCNRVIISRRGTTAFITQGLKGDKEIPISRITALQFKHADALTKGYLQFSIQGGVESKGGVFAAVADENTVMFTELDQPEFEEIKRYVNSVMDSEPIDFDQLRFSKLKTLKQLKLQETKEAQEKVIVSEKAFWRSVVKPSLIASIVSFICVSLAVNGSILHAIGGILLIISGVILCMAWIKSR